MRRIALPNLRSVSMRDVKNRLIGSLAEGWYVHGDQKSQDRRRLLISTYNANVAANLIGGSFWTGLLLLMNADDSFIGSMTMIATAANMLQMIAPLLLERFTQRKRLIILLRSALFFINIVVIGLIPLFPASRQVQLTMTAIAILAVNVLNAIISPGISVWHLQSVPPTVRTHFYTLITMTTGAVVAVFNLLGSALVDLFKSGGYEYAGLMVLRVVALALAAYDIRLYLKVAEYPYEATAQKFTLHDLLVRPFQEKIYLKTVAVTFLWNISANMPGAYYTVYLLKNMGVSYSYLMLVSFLNVPIVLFLTPIWRRVLTKHGWFKTLYIAMGLYLMFYVGLAFVTKQTMILYPISVVWGFLMGIGINLSFTGIPYVNIPQKTQTVFIGFYSTAANLAALLGVTIGKYFILWSEGITINLMGIQMVNKQYMMLLTAALMLLAAVGIWRIQRGMPRPEQ